jgi:hypothetical protein
MLTSYNSKYYWSHELKTERTDSYIKNYSLKSTGGSLGKERRINHMSIRTGAQLNRNGHLWTREAGKASPKHKSANATFQDSEIKQNKSELLR